MSAPPFTAAASALSSSGSKGGARRGQYGLSVGAGVAATDKGVESTASRDILNEALGGGAAESRPGRGGGGGSC